MEAPVVDSLRNRFEVLNNLVNWIADVWRSKNLVRRLLLCDVIIFTLFNPYVPLILKIAPTTLIPKNYELYFWVTVSFFFVIATIIAIRTKSNKTISADITLRSPIKGLLPFDTADEVIFTQLQRNHELIECSQVITDNNFRIGILSAESGNGKTSFLRAGLLPALQQLNHRCIYIKVTDIDPIISIKQTLTDSIVDEIPVDSNLIETFKNLVKIEGRDAPPLVILLDQFEQFFVHQKRKKDRELFIKQLCDWYKNNNALRVKILISIRSDFRGRLDEIHKAMGYSPGPQQIFLLEKFTPEQASSIFNTLAESVQLECDRSFIEEMTARELASSDDGLISPVDIQILSWMIAHQSTDSDRSFTRKAFQRLGGVEGLLERFLSRALDARESQLKRKNAVHVLLGLTDLDRNTRTGPLTSDELMLKLGNLISESDLRESLEWLVRGDVRLVQSSKNNQTELFELSHERLIPALRRVASKDLSEADKANFLLDRRSGEWQGNKHHRRYLLSLRELLLIRKQTPFLQWGQNRDVKKEFISASYRRKFIIATLILLSILLIISGFPLSKTQFIQLQLVKREMSELSRQSSDQVTLESVARAYVMDGDIERAENFLENMPDTYNEINLRRSTIESIIELGISELNIKRIENCLALVVKFGNKDDEVKYSLKIANAIYQLGDKNKALSMVEQIHKDLEKNKYYDKPFDMRLMLARGAINIGAISKANDVMSQIQNVTNNDPFYARRHQYLIVKAELMSLSGNAEKAIQLLESFNFLDSEYSEVKAALDATIIANKQAVKGNDEILNLTRQFLNKQFSEVKAVANATILANKQAGKSSDEILNSMRQFLNKKFSSDSIKIGAYIYVSQSLYAHGYQHGATEVQKLAMDWLVTYNFSGLNQQLIDNMESNPTTPVFFKQLRHLASKFSSPSDKSHFLKILTIKIAKLAGEMHDIKLLNEVLRESKQKDSDFFFNDSEIYQVISLSLAKVATKDRNINLTKQAQEYALMIKTGIDPQEPFISSLDNQPSASIAIAIAATACGDYRLARSIAKSQVNKDDELKTLAAILETKARINNPRLADGIWKSWDKSYFY